MSLVPCTCCSPVLIPMKAQLRTLQTNPIHAAEKKPLSNPASPQILHPSDPDNFKLREAGSFPYPGPLPSTVICLIIRTTLLACVPLPKDLSVTWLGPQHAPRSVSVLLCTPAPFYFLRQLQVTACPNFHIPSALEPLKFCSIYLAVHLGTDHFSDLNNCFDAKHTRLTVFHQHKVPWFLGSLSCFVVLKY